MQRLAARERAESVGGVLGAVLLDVELAQLLVDARLVRVSLGRVDIGRNALRALQVGEAQAGHAEGVFHQFAVGTAQASQGVEPAIALAACHLQVEHAEERLQRIVQPPLLEQRPALHVQRAVLVWVARFAAQHLGVGLLGLDVVARGEQQFAAAELCLGAVGRVRVLLHQPVERFQCRFQLTALFVRTRQLVQHAVVAGVLGIGLQEVVVARDCGAVVRRAVARAFAVGDARVGAVHFQVADAAHCFRALRRSRRHFEEFAVGRDCLVLAALDAGVRRHVHLAAGQALDRRRVIGGAGTAPAGTGAQAARDQEQQQRPTWSHGPPRA